MTRKSVCCFVCPREKRTEVKEERTWEQANIEVMFWSKMKRRLFFYKDTEFARVVH